MTYGWFSENAQSIWDFTRCARSDGTHYGTAGACRKGTEDPYSDWSPLAKGNYGEVLESPDGKRVIKKLLEHNGVKGEFGPHERALATKMGELGH